MAFFRYRLPGTEEVVERDFGSYSDDNRNVSFTVSTFYGPRVKYFPERSTTREEHRAGVERILEEIEKGEIEKCVLARTIVREGKVDIDSTFNRLCKTYPDAFVFLFESDGIEGKWMGASPELLLSKDGEILRTMALAGTRPAGSLVDSGHGIDGWDEKNIREQKIVTDFIVELFKVLGLNPHVGETITRKAGPVEHLMTPIEARIGPDTDDDEFAISLANGLSPTPALSGMPRDKAMRLIREIEGFNRGCYGGFCGPVFENGDFKLFVNLRSMQILDNKYALYTGGGIVTGSDPEEEWEETERKAETLLQCIVHSA